MIMFLTVLFVLASVFTSVSASAATVVQDTITLPSTIERIEEFAFSGCTGLRTIRIPNTLQTIGENAFNDCTGLTDIYFSGSQQEWDHIVIEAGNAPLLSAALHFTRIVANGNCGKNGDQVTWALDSSGLLTISGNGAMADYWGVGGNINTPWKQYNSMINEIVVEDGVTALGAYAFFNTSVVQATLPEGITTLPHACFCNCVNLCRISLPSTLTALDNECLFHTAFTSFTVPASITRLNGHFISGAKTPIVLDVESGNHQYKAMNGTIYTEDGKTLMMAPTAGAYSEAVDRSFVVPDGVSALGAHAFAYDAYYQNLYLPASVVSVGDYCFVGNMALKNIYFEGTEQQWAAILVGSQNSTFTSAEVHFNH